MALEMLKLQTELFNGNNVDYAFNTNTKKVIFWVAREKCLEKKAFKENPFRPVDSSKNGHFK